MVRMHLLASALHWGNDADEQKTPAAGRKQPFRSWSSLLLGEL
jgi:hypothetical protein